MPTEPSRAVFLSYASQDAEAARRLCETLRASGLEVWFDADGGLEHGDEWDQKIRRQIKECVLFLPVISANTQARHEGYFRIEWDLAAERARGIASGVPFILPVVIDDTREPDALVPDRFRAVQWTRLRGGEVPPEVRQRFLKLWSHRTGVLKHEAARFDQEPGHRRSGERDLSGPAALATAASRPRRGRLGAIIAGSVAVFILGALGLRYLRPENLPAPSGATGPSPATPAAGKPAALTSELAEIRARIVPDRWTSEDYAVVRPALDRYIQKNPEDAEAWALRSYIASLQVLRTIDYGTKVLQAGKADAEHALRLRPDSPLGELALGFHYVAMMTRGGEAEAARPHIERALAGLPPDIITRYAEIGYFAFSLQLEPVKRKAEAWLEADAAATFPRWCTAMAALVDRQAEAAEQWAERGATSRENATVVRSLFTLFEVNFFLRANLPAARAALERVPATARSHHRWIYGRWLLALTDRKWDEAIQELARTPETVLYDRSFRGPKALLTGIAHLKAGRTAPAAAQFQESERRLRELLATDPDDEEMRLALALSLAYAGKGAGARSELATVEPLLKGRPPYLYSGHARALMAETHAVLGDVDGLLPWLRLIFAEPSAVPYKPASFRLDPRFESVATDPRVEALLAGFSPRESANPAGAATTPDPKSVAVLAFANVSDDRDNEYFSDGIADELLTVLQKIPGLRVAARTSAFSFKGKGATAQEIGEKLGMAHIVDGSVRKSGNRVKITARLSRAATNQEIWSESYGPLELVDVFATQSEIAQKIVARLSGQLTGETASAVASTAAPAQAEIKALVQAATKGGTKNIEAHQLYLQARYLATRSGSADVARGIDYYEQALKRDPNFALAWAALARARLWQLSWEPLNPERAQQARIAATRALALHGDMADAHSVLAQIMLRHSFEWQAAKEGSARALLLAPTDAAILTDAAATEQALGSLEKSIELARQAIALDPVSVDARFYLALSYQFMGRLAEAESETRRMIELSSNGIFSHCLLSCILLTQGRTKEALAEAQREPEKMYRLQSLSAAHFALGQVRESDAVLETLIQEFKEVGPYCLAWVYTLRQDRDKAFEWLERAYHLHDAGISWVRADNLFKPLHSDPRWPAFLRKIGLADDQLK